MASTSAKSDQPELPDNVSLPANYKAKRCRFCRAWSCSLCPWNTSDTILSQWYPVLPWSRGNKSKPVGDKCKVCQIVSRYGFDVQFFFVVWLCN